jgi:hypothetical protein
MALFGFGIPSLIFWLITLFTGVITAIQVWHWHTYSLKSSMVAFAEIVYLAGVLLLLGVAFIQLNILT